MIIKDIGRFHISVDEAPQFNITLIIDGEILEPILMHEEDARDLIYSMESALRDIQKGKQE